MSANPWDKFFWNDWDNDPALKLCSFAAQGLWMRCLCICAKSDPKGYVSVNGNPLNAMDIARLTGGQISEVETLLQELALNGVFSRDRTQRIYSRRMVRDVKKTATARNNGKMGGNPSIGKIRGIPPSVNPPLKGGDNTQKPEARSQKENKEEKKGRGSRFALHDPPVDWILFCQAQRPDLDPGRTFDAFRDYWIAKPGKDGVKLDWTATWRNWVRNEKSTKGMINGKPKSSLNIVAEGIATARAKREQGQSSQIG